MARAIGRYLIDALPGVPLILLDRDPAALKRLQSFLNYPHLTLVEGDAGDATLLARFMNGAAGAVGAASYRYHEQGAVAAIEQGAHWVDLGGNPDVVKRQMRLDDAARSAGVGVVPDCGLAPGLVNIIVGRLVAEFDAIDEIHIRVGGLAQDPKGPLQYQLLFSPEGLANEYYEPAQVIEEGEARSVESLTGWERVWFGPPVGTLEAFHTSGGSSTMVETFAGRVKALDYKTLRYPGHLRKIKLLKDLGLFAPDPLTVGKASVAPRELMGRLLEAKIGWCDADMTAVKIWVTGLQDGNPVRREARLVDYTDPKTGLTSMMRTTGFPAAEVLRSLVDGTTTARGLLRQERDLPASSLLSRIADYGIKIEFLD